MNDIGTVIGKLLGALVANGALTMEQMEDIVGMSADELKQHAAAADPKGSEENDTTN